jgi:hypothetical protein
MATATWAKAHTARTMSPLSAASMIVKAGAVHDATTKLTKLTTRRRAL